MCESRTKCCTGQSISRKKSLSLGRMRFVERMQHLNFGAIENLAIIDGEPALDSHPRLVRELKFGGDSGPRPESSLDDFTLKSQVAELFAYFDDIGNGVIDRIEVKNGLPFRMLVTESASR